MSELITRSYNGFIIQFEFIEGQLMANATAMCAAFKKRPVKWQNLDATKAYIAALQVEDAKEAKSPERTLVETRQGGTNPGTWIVQDLILELAGWLDVPFKVQMHKWVAELLRTGQVVLAPKPKTNLEVLKESLGVLDGVVKNLMEHDNRLTAVEQKMHEVEARQVVTEVEYFTIKGWANLQKKTVTETEAKALGVKAGNLSRSRDVRIDKVPNGSWGTINSYHRSILQEIF